MMSSATSTAPHGPAVCHRPSLIALGVGDVTTQGATFAPLTPLAMQHVRGLEPAVATDSGVAS